MRYQGIVTAITWLVAILALILALVVLVEFVTREPIIEFEPGVVTLHTHRDGHPVMMVLLEDGELYELTGWTEPIGARVEVPVVTGFKSLPGILYQTERKL
jgi:hypothetical protein